MVGRTRFPSLSACAAAVMAGCSQAPEPVEPATAVATAAEAPVAEPAPAAPSAQPAPAQQTAAASAQPARPAYTNPPPLIAGAHWHHFHVNSVDPKASVDYYTRHFDAKRARFADMMDAVWTQKSWLLFNRVSTKASTKLNTAIWHIGWGAPDSKSEFKRQTELGNRFFQPLTDISTGLSSFSPDQFYYMYVESPDRTLIELNTARHDNFGHLHMFSDNPIAAGDWYIRMFGLTGRALSLPTTRIPEPRISRDGTLQVGPSSSLMFDNVNMIIFPVQYAKKAYAEDWAGTSAIQPTRGTVNDHFGISVPNLDEALKVMRANGVNVTQEPRDVQGKFRFAFIEGPDRVAIELIEDHSEHPPEES